MLVFWQSLSDLVPAEAVVEMVPPVPSQLERLFSKPGFCKIFVPQEPPPCVEHVAGAGTFRVKVLLFPPVLKTVMLRFGVLAMENGPKILAIL